MDRYIPFTGAGDFAEVFRLYNADEHKGLTYNPSSGILKSGAFRATLARSAWATGLRITLSDMVANDVAQIRFGKAESSYNEGYIGYKHIADGSPNNFVTIGLFSRDHALTILGSGNVGIGTTAPAAKLDVSGVARVTSLQIGTASAHVTLTFENGGLKIDKGVYSTDYVSARGQDDTATGGSGGGFPLLTKWESYKAEMADGYGLSAGTSTIFLNSSVAYDSEAEWVSGDYLTRFVRGDRLYDDVRTSTHGEGGGLGPVYAGYSCGSCHRNAGRTRPAAPAIMDFRLCSSTSHAATAPSSATTDVCFTTNQSMA